MRRAVATKRCVTCYGMACRDMSWHAMVCTCNALLCHAIQGLQSVGHRLFGHEDADEAAMVVIITVAMTIDDDATKYMMMAMLTKMICNIGSAGSSGGVKGVHLRTSAMVMLMVTWLSHPRCLRRGHRHRRF